MANKNLRFKTNINCEGCVATVKPHLDLIAGAEGWQVATTDKDKVLTVTTDNINPEQVMTTIQKAGFKIEILNP